jgi:delta24(24(1))-sterol reductase
MVQSYGGTGNSLRQRSVDSSTPAKALTTTDEGRKVDELLDKHQT